MVLNVKRIKSLMQDLGLSQLALSELCGVNRSTVSEWLAHKYLPQDRHLKLLAENLGVEPDLLLEKDPEPVVDVKSGDAAGGSTGNSVSYITVENIRIETLVVSSADGADTVSQILEGIRRRTTADISPNGESK